MTNKFLCILVILLLSSCSSKNYTRLYTLESPDKMFEIRINYTESGWVNSGHPIYIEAEKKINGAIQKLNCYTIKNDGANLTENNVQIESYDNDSITLIFNGEEQESDTLQFMYRF